MYHVYVIWLVPEGETAAGILSHSKLSVSAAAVLVNNNQHTYLQHWRTTGFHGSITFSRTKCALSNYLHTSYFFIRVPLPVLLPWYLFWTCDAAIVIITLDVIEQFQDLTFGYLTNFLLDLLCGHIWALLIYQVCLFCVHLSSFKFSCAELINIDIKFKPGFIWFCDILCIFMWSVCNWWYSIKNAPVANMSELYKIQLLSLMERGTSSI